MAKGREKEYFCTLVSEEVEVTLKNKPSMSINSNKELFVQCNQSDCQYVDINQYPCPLTLNLFEDEIERRAEKRREKEIENQL